MNIKKLFKEQIAQPQIRLKKSTLRGIGIKVPKNYDGQIVVNRHDFFRAATLHSGSSLMKTSDRSQVGTLRNSVRIIKKIEHLNSLQKSTQKQHPLKAASSVHDDGFYGEKQLLLGSREKTESLNRRQHKIKATRGDNKDFSGMIITKQAEFGRPEGESETEHSHTNKIENGNQKRLAYILQATHKTDNNDVDHKQMLSEAGEVLIMLFLADTERETQTKPSQQRKLILNTDTGWETVNIPIKELDDPPIRTKVIKGIFIVEAECLKEGLFSLEMYALDRAERIDIKPAESKVTPVSAHTEAQVKETEGKIEHTETNNTPHKNMGINHNKQEENVPSEESVIPSPPSLKMTETETAKTEDTAETTPVNMEIKETTSSMEIFNQGSTQKADRLPSTETPRTTMSPECESNAEPRFIQCKTGNIQATIEKSFSGLRMRQDIPADTNKLHEGTGTEDRAVTDRKEDQNDPKASSFTFAKPLQTIHKQAADTLAEVSQLQDQISVKMGGMCQEFRKYTLLCFW
ncbi:hypothetical protein ABVT39_005466 [Epinephelus coioides]